MNNDLLWTALAWAIVQVVRAMPALIWSLRCRPSSTTYRCPPLFTPWRNRSVEPDSRLSGRPVVRRVPANSG